MLCVCVFVCDLPPVSVLLVGGWERRDEHWPPLSIEDLPQMSIREITTVHRGEKKRDSEKCKWGKYRKRKGEMGKKEYINL